MSLRRVSRLITVTVLLVLWGACGQYYRPVVIPISTTPPTPANFHAVFAVNANAPLNPGSGMQIDVSGDTRVGVASVGTSPTHAAISPNDSRIFVTSAGSLASGGADTVSAFTPSFGLGIGPVTTFSLPTGSLPVFVGTAQPNAAYVANFGTNSVAALNTATNVVSTIVPVGNGPVALAETPNVGSASGNRLYVANQTDGTVTSINAPDMSQNSVITVGSQPVWVAARNDGQRVYVLTQGGGQLSAIDTATDVVISTLSVGAGANFIGYDPHLNRLYVTNPVSGTVSVFSATGGVNDTPTLLASISMNAGTTPPCPAGCSPDSVAALPDGSRFYVASYQLVSPCPDPNAPLSPCMIPRLTVFDANSLAVRVPSIFLLAPNLYPPQSTFSQPYALAPLSSCNQITPYTPGVTRFRVFTTASSDSSRVYVSMCDAGAVAVVNATNNSINGGPPADTLITDLPAPTGVCTQPSCVNVASVTAFAITSNVVTFQATNAFTPGQRVAISGLTTGNFMNGQTMTVLASGLSGSQFECYFTHADVAPTTDSGSAVPGQPSQAPILLLTGQ